MQTSELHVVYGGDDDDGDDDDDDDDDGDDDDEGEGDDDDDDDYEEQYFISPRFSTRRGGFTVIVLHSDGDGARGSSESSIV